MNHDTVLSVLGQRSVRSVRGVLPQPGEMRTPARSLYLHVPFCAHKCHYCDFYSIVDTRGRQDAFVARLEAELRAWAPYAGPLRTIFVGGGTPTLLRAELWRRLLGTMAECFDLSEMHKAGEGGDVRAEFTVECNPETASAELMDVLRAGGVTRVSVGAQSFAPGHLKTLERWHDPGNVGRAIEMARRAGIGRQSLDLIYAIPGQTLAECARDLDEALALGTEHMSCYSLTYEPNTAMTARLHRGEFVPASEELDADMFELVGRRLQQAGLERYEISNFARPGRECLHNLTYWRQEPWLAAGPAASGHVSGHRYKNTPRLDDYLAFDDAGFAPIAEHEAPDAKRALIEVLMTGVRIREGVEAASVEELARAAGPGVDVRVRATAQRLLDAGLLSDVGGRWAPTGAGILVADQLGLDFLQAVDV